VGDNFNALSDREQLAVTWILEEERRKARNRGSQVRGSLLSLSEQAFENAKESLASNPEAVQKAVALYGDPKYRSATRLWGPGSPNELERGGR